MRKLNTKLAMSTARHSQINSLIERANESMQILMHCYIRTSFMMIAYLIYPWLILLHMFNQ